MDELKVPVVRSRLRDAARNGEFASLRAELERRGVDDAALVALVAAVNDFPESQTALLRLRGEMLGTNDPSPFLLERYALLVTAAQHVADLPGVAVPEDVVQLLLEELVWLTTPPDAELKWFEAGRYIFSALCKIVTLRRFPAGHLHWEISGFPRSAFLRARGFDPVRLAGAVMRMGGFAPVFVPHNPWRKAPLVMLERQQHLSFYRMAVAMDRQPAIRGFVAQSWFHSPDVPRVSPHLAWVNRVFHDWGGVVVDAGPAGSDSGVFERGESRRRLADAGQYAPRLGLVVWPRRAMLRWAEHYASQQAAG
ncbi:MAG: hypothetical protein AUJ01_04540 [Acidobacteria bacterium 13_1_40CM_3_65_5]|nr:MAG: hypothetical protein AUH41_09735 [Gemmatimonadetes bacterium 13_1_40CM_66_11]OLD20206.1 MAG: hypothetical protein AUJ01_04540 [Acidobacteria bacterium 13_1_40CM_3_65_5]